MLSLKAVSWVSPLKRRQFFEKYAQTNGFDFLSPAAWYAQDQDKLLATKGIIDIIVQHKGSSTKALVDIFSDIGLEEINFKRWNVKKDWRAIMEDFAAKKGFDHRSPSTWYKQQQKIKLDMGVKTVLRYYLNNLPNALVDLFPDIGLVKSQFKSSMSWNSEQKRRNFFERYAQENNFDFLSAEAWYSQPLYKILDRDGARSIREYHSHSIRRALIDLFPNIGLDMKKFKYKHKEQGKKRARKKLQDILKKRRQVFINYALDHNFDHLIPEAWYSQSIRTIYNSKGVINVVQHYRGSVTKAINDLFPGIDLDPRKFSLPSSRIGNTGSLNTDVAIFQIHLEKVIKNLFGSESIVYNARKKSQVTNPNTGNVFEIDVLIPKLQLGFEFQDEYHYMYTWYSQRTLSTVQELDNSKKNSAQSIGMTLIQIPYWWDGTAESLIATIQFERPDLFFGVHSATPVALNPITSELYFKEVPNVGSLMLASFPNAQNFIDTVSSNTWWTGEKYDGVRFCWNFVKHTAYSRSGREIPVLDVIAATLPKTYLDGEFWFGRGTFPSIYSLIYGECSWPSLRMISFDCPDPFLQHFSFEQRYEVLLNAVLASHPVNLVPHRILCQGGFHVNYMLSALVNSGGEGVILRRITSQYVHGRSKHLIKLKAVYGDAEGVVVAVSTQAISLKIPSGQIFQVPMKDVKISSLKVGEIVTFSYEKFTAKDIPFQPKIFQRRSDLSWKDVVANFTSHPEETSAETPTSPKKTKMDSLVERRKFFENYATENNFDFLSPEAWYSQSRSRIVNSEGGRAVLKYHDNSVITALVDLFPDIGIQKSKFKRMHEATLHRNLK